MLLAQFDWTDIIGLLGGGAGLGVAVKAFFDYLLGRKKIAHSASMEKDTAEAERREKDEDRVLEEWKKVVRQQDRRITKLEDEREDWEREKDVIRKEYHAVLLQNERLKYRLELCEQALMSAQIPIPHREASPPEGSDSDQGGL